MPDDPLEAAGSVLSAVEAELHGDVPAVLAAAAKRLARACDDRDVAAHNLATAARELRITMEAARQYGKAERDRIDEVAAKREERRGRRLDSSSG